MQNVLNAVNGKKTYIVSGVSVVLGVVQLLAGHNYAQIVPYLLAGAFGGSLRHAIAKAETKLPAPVETVGAGVVDKVESTQPQA